MTAKPDHNLDSLLFDLIEWIAKEPRSYRQTMEVWRTSCPRLAVWEEAVNREFVFRDASSEYGVQIKPSSSGLAFIAAHINSLHSLK